MTDILFSLSLFALLKFLQDRLTFFNWYSLCNYYARRKQIMKQLFYTITTVLLIAGCKTSKDYLSRVDEDKTLFDVVKKLNKSSNDADALAALPVLYPKAQDRHLKKINTYNSYKEINRWDKILDEYATLQKMYDAISNSATAEKLVAATSYQNAIYDIKQSAAEDYYQQAQLFLAGSGRDNAKQAYSYFKKANQYVSNYKDTKAKMDEAYQNAIVNVQINPVQDNSFFFNTGWGNYGYNYSNEYFQRTLVRELGGTYSSRYPAKFYTEWEARRDNIQPDWVVDLTLRNIDIPRPSNNSYSRNVSKQIETGRDSSGKTIYQTAQATLYITRQSFTARGEMMVNISDVVTHKNISHNIVYEDYSWQEESATYSGDSRALSNSDWALVNNRINDIPGKEKILNELYRKIYPQVKNKITYAVDW